MGQFTITPDIVRLFSEALKVPDGADSVDPPQMARIVCESFHQFLYVFHTLKRGESVPGFSKDMKLDHIAEKIIAHAYDIRTKVIGFNGGPHADEVLLNQHLPAEKLDFKLDEDRGAVVRKLRPQLFELAHHAHMDARMLGLEVLAQAAGAISNGVSYNLKPRPVGRMAPNSFAPRKVNPGDQDYHQVALEVVLPRVAAQYGVAF